MDFKHLVLMVLSLLAVMWAAQCTKTLTYIWDQLQHRDGYVERELVVERVIQPEEPMPNGGTAEIGYIYGDVTIDDETHAVRVNARRDEYLHEGSPLQPDHVVTVLHNADYRSVDEVGGIGHIMVKRNGYWPHLRRSMWLFAAVGYLPLLAMAIVVVTTVINRRRAP